MQVRSDFKVTLKLRDANGKVHRIGTYDAEHVASEGDEGARPVPHLQRMSPDGRWLASLDADRMRLDLRAVDGSREGRPGTLRKPLLVELKGIEGTVRQFRFLEAMSGFVLITESNLYLLPFDPDAQGDEAAAEIQAEPVFDPAKTENMDFLDTRILPEGVIAHVREHIDGDPFWHRGDVYWIRIADDTVQDLVSLVPDHLTATGANVRSQGRIVVALGVHDYDIAEQLGQGDLSELWTIETPADDIPNVSAVTQCANDWCNVINWTPRTERLTYALDWSEVYREGATPDADPIAMTLSLGDDYGGRMHTLWADAAEEHLLGANHDGVQVWTSEGEPLWQWQHPRNYAVNFADFEPDGSVLVAAGTQLWRIEEGRGKRLLRTRGKHRARRNGSDDVYDEEGWGTGAKQSFIDDAFALPDGSIAFSVVDLEETWEEVDGGWPDELEAKIHQPVVDPGDLLDPFATAPSQGL
jgi:hypothetical protein